MLTKHLVIFAKQPRMGRIKTRLAKDIGTVNAWRFYCKTLGDLVNRVSTDSLWKTYIATTPDNAILRDYAHSIRCNNKLLLISQGRGGLGQRMERAFKSLPTGPVVIIGSDIPDIGNHHIKQAFKVLGHQDCVFGPAHDGGFWLVGFKRCPHLPKLFKNVRWSTQHALSDTLSGLPIKMKIGLVATLNDIDTVADLKSNSKNEPSKI